MPNDTRAEELVSAKLHMGAVITSGSHIGKIVKGFLINKAAPNDVWVLFEDNRIGKRQI